MTARFGIVVVNFGSADLIRNNLGRFARDLPAAEIIVVDNFHSPQQRHEIKNLCADNGWTLEALDTNGGFGTGVNAGVNRAFQNGVADVLLINPDATIDDVSVRRMAQLSQADRLALISPVVLTPEGGRWFDGMDLYLSDGEVRSHRKRDDGDASRCEWLSGACLWITKELWTLVGMFDDDYFMYWEDVDYSFRVLEAGGRLWVATEAFAEHDEGGTQREGIDNSPRKSGLYYYYNIRNRMLFATRHLDRATVNSWWRSAVPHARSVLLRGGRRQFLHPVTPLKAAYFGLRDARRLTRSHLAGGPAR